MEQRTPTMKVFGNKDVMRKFQLVADIDGFLGDLILIAHDVTPLFSGNLHVYYVQRKKLLRQTLNKKILKLITTCMIAVT